VRFNRQAISAAGRVLAGDVAKTSGEDFDNFIERLDLQEWLERLEKELNQIKAKLKG
jgi:hypothetical protein